MRRAVFCLAAVGVLAIAVNQASAGVSVRVGTPHVSVGTAVGTPVVASPYGYYPGYVTPRVYTYPQVVIPCPHYPPVVYPPIHRHGHRRYIHGPQSGFRYSGPGVSVGVRW